MSSCGLVLAVHEVFRPQRATEAAHNQVQWRVLLLVVLNLQVVAYQLPKFTWLPTVSNNELWH
jgi:amino acid permease